MSVVQLLEKQDNRPVAGVRCQVLVDGCWLLVVGWCLVNLK